MTISSTDKPALSACVNNLLVAAASDGVATDGIRIATVARKSRPA
jgi:hypothetical protein